MAIGLHELYHSHDQDEVYTSTAGKIDFLKLDDKFSIVQLLIVYWIVQLDTIA